jgi:hypothetical protein
MENEFYSNTPSSVLAKEIQAIGQDERSGVLEVTGSGTVTRLHFRRGALVGADRVAGSDLWPLGDYLTYGGLLSPRDVLGAMDMAQEKKLQVEEVLLSYKGVTEDLLSRYANLQLEESLFPLFSLESPLVHWFDERPRVPQLVTPLPAEWILKESRRRRDLWPALEETVGKSTAVYDREPSLLAELLGYTSAKEDALPSMGGNARIVFFYANGERTVAQVARKSGLGLFQVYQAFSELIDADVIDLVVAHGTGETPPIYRPYLGKVLLTLTYGILALGLFLGVTWAIEHQEGLKEHWLSHYSQDTQVNRAKERARIVAALDLHQLEFGHYPTSLEELVEVGYAMIDRDGVVARYGIQLHAGGYRLLTRDKE